MRIGKASLFAEVVRDIAKTHQNAGIMKFFSEFLQEVLHFAVPFAIIHDDIQPFGDCIISGRTI